MCPFVSEEDAHEEQDVLREQRMDWQGAKVSSSDMFEQTLLLKRTSPLFQFFMQSEFPHCFLNYRVIF